LHRTNLDLFHAYARLELHAGRVDEARKVYRTALAATRAAESNGTTTADTESPLVPAVCKLTRALVELEASAARPAAALADVLALALDRPLGEAEALVGNTLPPVGGTLASLLLKSRMVRAKRRCSASESLPDMGDFISLRPTNNSGYGGRQPNTTKRRCARCGSRHCTSPAPLRVALPRP